jgi:hypothetical protein
MMQISYPIREPSPLSPRTAKYVAALMREGDNFDYDKWFQGVREEEAQAKKVPATFTSGQISATEIGNPITVFGFRGALPNCTLMTETVPVTGRVRRSHQEPGGKIPKARVRRRLEKVRDAWDDFQVSRTRDAVYRYLGAVFEVVVHYKVRRRTRKLLRRAFKFANLPFDKNADPFTAVIRCTSDGNADNKSISKWARALRYVARCKVPTTRVKAFMKETGGVNACADRYAKNAGRGAK